MRQIAVEAPTVCTLLRYPTATRSSIGAIKTVPGRVCLLRTRTQMFPDRSLAGPQPQHAAHRATRSKVPAARPPILVALHRYSWHE